MSDSSTELFVRPYGYAASDPVVAPLGIGDAFLGNEAAASPACDRDFAHVLTLTQAPAAATTHHRPLTDDDQNDWRAFADAADTARELFDADGSVLIHCRAGVSRSAAVAAAATAVRASESFVDALHAVQDARPHAVPRPALHALGVYYVADRQNESALPQTATSFSSSPDS